MKTILLWIKKDLKEMKWYGILWILFLIFKGLVLSRLHGVGGSASGYLEEHEASILTMFGMLVPLLNGITWLFQVLLIGGFVVQDPIQGVRSFWMTRPFSTVNWVISKGLIVTLLILLPALLVDLTPCFVSRLPGSWILGIFFWQMVAAMTLTLIVSIIALSSERKGSFYGLFALMMVGWLLWKVTPFFLSSYLFPKIKFLGELLLSDFMPKRVTDEVTMEILVSALTLVGLFAVMVSYFRYKSKWVHLGLFLIVIGFTPKLVGYGMQKRKFNIFDEHEKTYAQNLETHDPQRSPAVIPSLDLDTPGMKKIGFEFHDEAIENEKWIRPFKFDVKLGSENLDHFDQTENMGYEEVKDGVHLEALSKLMNNAEIQNARNYQHPSYGSLYLPNLKKKKSDALVVKKESPQVKGIYELCGYRKAAEISEVQKSAVLANGLKIEWLDWKTKSGTTVIVLRENEWENPLDPELSTASRSLLKWQRQMGGAEDRQSIYVLYNEKKSEVYLSRPPEEYAQIVVNQYNSHYSSKMRPLIFLGVDEEWLKESKLVALEIVPEGRGKFEYTIPNEVIRPLIVPGTSESKETP